MEEWQQGIEERLKRLEQSIDISEDSFERIRKIQIQTEKTQADNRAAIQREKDRNERYRQEDAARAGSWLDLALKKLEAKTFKMQSDFESLISWQQEIIKALSEREQGL